MIALASLALLAAAQDAPLPPRVALALEGVTVIDLGEPAARRLRDHTVLVDGERIAAVGPRAEIEVPEGAERVDARGLFVVPGLAEMHGHLPTPGGHPALNDSMMLLYLAGGVTTVRGMLGDPGQLELRDAIERGEVLGPRLIVGSPPLHGGSATSPDQARGLVEQYAEAGYDHLKVHEGLAPEVYDAIVAAAESAGIGFGGHVSDLVGLETALAARQATVDHLDNFVEALVDPAALAAAPGPVPLLSALADPAAVDRERLPELARATREAGVAVVPTQALWAAIHGGQSGDELKQGRDELRYVPAPMLAAWSGGADQRRAAFGAGGAPLLALRDELLVALDEAGVPILLGTDSPQIFSVPGFSIAREALAMQAAGLSPERVLRSATRDVAAWYGELDERGEVAAGRRADLVLLAADPLENATHLGAVAGVVVDGRWLSRAWLDARLEEIAARVAGG